MYMMQNVINSAKRIGGTEKLNILTSCNANEKYISLLCKTGHNFYILPEIGNSQWKNDIEKAPSNLTVISPTSRIVTSFDAVMCYERTAQYDQALEISNKLFLPLIMVDECSKDLIRPHNVLETLNGDIESLNHRKAAVTVASNYLCTDWKSLEGLNVTVPTSIDLSVFKKNNEKHNESSFFGTQLTPTRIAIDNSVPQGVLEHLLKDSAPSHTILPTNSDVENKEVIYQTATYFINTYKNITVKTLEAMASENVVICFNTPETQRFFDNGVDAILIRSPQELNEVLVALDNDPSKRKKIGAAARKKVEKTCEENNFIKKWGFVFDFVRNSFYKP